MFELFIAMMKVEWRIHSTMFGSVSFAIFPVMIFGIAFMGSFLTPLMRQTLPAGDLTLMIHASYLMLGIMVGGFGLFGNEVMNRRFGQASPLSYSARILPLSERFIFANFIIKNTVYYFFLWVLPFGLGHLALHARSRRDGPPSPADTCPRVPLRALHGLLPLDRVRPVENGTQPRPPCARLRRSRVCAEDRHEPGPPLPPVHLNSGFSWTNLIASCIILAVLFGVSIRLFPPESVGSEKTHRDAFAPLMQRFSFLPNSALAAKDAVDLYRSGSMIGQTIFSFLLPLAVIWFFLSLMDPFFPLTASSSSLRSPQVSSHPRCTRGSRCSTVSGRTPACRSRSAP